MTMLKKVSMYAAMLSATCFHLPSAIAQKKSFTIYEYIPYRAHVVAGETSQIPAFREYLESVGIHPIDVVYDNRYLTDGKPDEKKIEAVAKQALATHTPVSFDTEFGNRFKPETVIPQVTEILNIYHRYNTAEPVGVYATAPQNTYAWKPDIDRFDTINDQYQPVAQLVDFLSPVLYNYEGPDTEAWKRAAIYNVAAAKKYKTGKRILPYMTVTIRLDGSGKDDATHHGNIRTVTEAEMLTRLQTLYDLGADGCILWASSGDRTEDGKLPIFDRNSGWGKALADFADAHH